MIDSIKKYSKAINRILLFIAAILLVIYIFPRQGKFRYEYTHGRPWTHETLIAPFDFPIHKSQAELRAERENALHNFRPYFNYEPSVSGQMTQFFEETYVSQLPTLLSTYPFLTNRLRNNDSKTVYNHIKELAQQKLISIYNTGLISLPEEYEELPESTVIMVVRNNFAEPYEIGEFFNYQSAYLELSTIIFDIIDKNSNVSQDQTDNLISNLQLNRYLEANIRFEPERTEQERQNILRNISLTSGIVLAGQRIIETGELITEETGRILDSLRLEYETSLGRGNSHYFILAGQATIIVLLFVIIFLFLYYFRTDVYNNLLSVLFLLMMVSSMILMASISHRTDNFPIYVIPFAILPIIVRIFFDSRLAFFIHVTTVLLAAFYVSNSFEFVILQIPAGLTAMFSLFRMVRRSQLVRAAILVFLSYSLFYTGLSLWQEGDFLQINHNTYFYFLANGVLLLMIYPLIYIFEKLFGFLSDVTLVELADTNHPVLRRLAEKAPGTFQHSIQVGNLAQEAVYKIGGNPLLVRAGAMYHDIGKLWSPIYFTENQSSGMNPHDNMPYDESAQLVIHHIENGVKMAQKEKLPRQIIDFITTHQGTMKTKYFYNSYVNQNPGEDPDVSLFTYPGPTPFTKETAVLMMADSVEAASRSLKNYSDDEIDRLVENIINDQIAENQFIDAPITFKEITEVKEVFKQKLKNIYHARVEYPKLKKGK
ncbi:HD family phosphohydrolase [Alkalitalea saponilacus]|uniref:HD/PDEase domain-containing protein n=1 Tax=Alkalitalea saponilacus TaxID=889453 RepID=A0A1T5F7I8_9BACT|nr:HDIG domain-containing metalloprotein [Alkalitalea saponilacus]ASB50150.1 transmembrane HD family protein [Alkalitalea saponilacus]SKB92081.1 hypothetical protein SAMN03080601_01505 [Alkalitalea saponilacus]